ncbi:hypothetical protein TNCV_485781 [Trichonephila clavipes]|nr:hypothetical protein TNCV_485781 [Trichonephila clavipes]
MQKTYRSPKIATPTVDRYIAVTSKQKQDRPPLELGLRKKRDEEYEGPKASTTEFAEQISEGLHTFDSTETVLSVQNTCMKYKYVYARSTTEVITNRFNGKGKTTNR